jgi:hydroxymethylbilane synthase
VFISSVAASPWDLPQGARVGTASVRRAAHLLARRPDLKTAPLRGNVGTRLEKLARGEADATFLALAGLKRLGLDSHATRIMSIDEMLPAAGQGALCVQTREDDEEARAIAASFNCSKTSLCVQMERAFLAGLDGSCRTPIAALAVIEGGEVHFRGELLSLDGAQVFRTSRTMPYTEDCAVKVVAAGAEAAAGIRAQAGEDFFKELGA